MNMSTPFPDSMGSTIWFPLAPIKPKEEKAITWISSAGNTLNKPSGALKNPGGFTLLEIILVLVFIALIAALTTPFVMSTLDRIKHQTKAREINSALRFARSEAISKKVITTFNANTRNKKYWIASGDDKNSSNSRTLDPGFTMSYVNDNQMTRDKDTDGETFTIKFYPRGNSTGGAILVEKVSPESSDEPYEIIIDPVTGSSRIEHETQ